jgi:prepilin-type N-terminal cleavage/methylation domain-containing protein
MVSARPCRRWLTVDATDGCSDDDGMSIVEMMVAIFILGVALSALAGVIMASIRSVSRNEREATATALSVQVIEELQTLPWTVVALYANETSDSSPLPGTGRWHDRLDSTGTFEGHTLSEVPAYSGTVSATNPDRDDRVPLPSTQAVRKGVTYHVDRYITWVDKDGSGTPETKRFTIVVSWEDIDGSTRDIVTEAERAPTQDEAGATYDGTRVILLTVAPNPVDLDATTGEVDDTLTFEIRTNAGVTDASLYVPRVNSTGVRIADREVTLTATEPDPNGGFVRFSGQIAGSADHKLWTGDVEVTFTALTTAGTPETISAVTTLVTRNGPWTPPAGSPTETESTAPSPSPSPTETWTPSYPVSFVGTPSVPDACVNSGSFRLKTDLVLSATVKGLIENRGNVSVTYPFWTTNQGGQPDTKATASMSRQAGGTESMATYVVTFPANSDSPLFKPNKTVHLQFRVDRDVDGSNETVTVPMQVVSC